MKVGLTTSAIGHALVIAWGLVSLPSATPFQTEAVESLPVDLLTIDEFTKLTKGSKTAELKPEPSPADPAPEQKTEAENPGKTEADKPSPKPEEQKVATLPPAAAPPPAPEPPTPAPPDPKPVEAPPEPPAPPAQAEPTPPEPQPEPEAALEPTPMLADAPRPRAKPTPPKRTSSPASPTEKKFDADQVAALLNKTEPTGGGAKSSTQQASLGSPTGRAQKMTQSELDALRGQIGRCWSPPVGAIGAENLVVTIQMALNQDGTLVGAPQVLNSSSDPTFRAAADSAIRAVRRCAPYTLPPEKYAAWQDVKVNFDPRQMLGGW